MARLRSHIAVVLLLATLAAGSAGPLAQQSSARPASVILVRPADVKWTDYPDRPGVKQAVLEGDLTKPGPFVMRVKFPAGYKRAAHTHPVDEHTTVLAGSMRIGYGTNEDGPTEALAVGTIVITPANTPHFFVTPQETIVQTHGIGPWATTPVKK